MNPSETMILKLGGSVITDKSGECSVDQERLLFVAREIAKRSGDLRLIVVHGAGSCGHPEAHRHHLDKGVDYNNKAGIAITHAAVSSLNAAVVDALRAEGVDAVGVHPLGSCVAENGRLRTFECGPLKAMLELGIVPVLHGDVVMDDSRGACIVSGDQLVRALPQQIPVNRIGLATDVEGVMDDGQVVREIRPETVGSLTLTASGHTDVTGGMKGKIEELLQLAEEGTESEIFHILRLGDFLDNVENGGTRVLK